MGYEVRTPVFEGPFDLLLHLILRSEVELFELSLRTIVDEYLVEIERMGALDLDVVNVTKIASMLEKATENTPPPPPPAAAAAARFARDPAEYRPRNIQLMLIDGGEAS